MKKVLFVFVALILSASCIGQYTWEYYHKYRFMLETIYHMIELSDGNYMSTGVIFLGANNDKENDSYSVVRKHHYESGTVLIEKEYNIDSLAASLGWIFYDPENETYTIVGSAYKYFDQKKRGYFLTTHWDSELNLIRDTIIRLQPEIENNTLWFFNGIYSSNNEYVLLGNYNEFPNYPFQNNKLLFVKLDQQGNIAFVNWYREVGGGNHVAIIEDELKNRYILPGQRTYFFDHGFNKKDSIITLNSIDYFPNMYYTSVIFQDSMILSSAKFDSNANKGLVLFNKEMNLLRSVNISKTSVQVWDGPFWGVNLDFVDTSFIYVGSQAYDSDYFTIAKVNPKLQPYWIKYKSEGDEDAHGIMGLKATSDGGCLLYGLRGVMLGYPNFPHDYGAWALKLDADGNTVSTKDHSPTRWEITVYPNPSSGDFRIEIEGEVHSAVLMLFDMQGRQVRHYDQLSEGSHTFDFSGLPTGAYVWKLLHNGEVLGDGKWIKGK